MKRDIISLVFSIASGQNSKIYERFFFLIFRTASASLTSHINSWYLRVGRPPKAGTLRNAAEVRLAQLFFHETLSVSKLEFAVADLVCVQFWRENYFLTWLVGKYRREEAFPIFPVFSLLYVKVHKCFLWHYFHERIQTVTLVRSYYLRQKSR